jgi:hypothetical protein
MFLKLQEDHFEYLFLLCSSCGSKYNGCYFFLISCLLFSFLARCPWELISSFWITECSILTLVGSEPGNPVNQLKEPNQPVSSEALKLAAGLLHNYVLFDSIRFQQPFIPFSILSNVCPAAAVSLIEFCSALIPPLTDRQTHRERERERERARESEREREREKETKPTLAPPSSHLDFRCWNSRLREGERFDELPDRV